MGLLIHGKDNQRQLHFTMASYAKMVQAFDALQNYAYPGQHNLGYLFPFESKCKLVHLSIVAMPDGRKLVAF